MGKIIDKILLKFGEKANTIFLGIFITNISTFMLNAFLTVFMSTQLGFDAGTIGFVLMISLISQRGFTFIGGLLADRFGLKKLLIFGLLLRSIGYLLFLIASNLVLLIFTTTIVGLGGALKDPPMNAAIVNFSSNHHVEAFAYKSMIVNLSAAVGPVIGTWLYPISMKSIFIITSLSHIIFSVIAGQLDFNEKTHLKNSPEDQDTESLSWTQIIKNKNLLYLTAITMGFWFLYVQLNLTVPLYISNILGKESLVGIVYSLEGIVVLIFQYLLIKVSQKYLNYKKMFQFGYLIFSCSFLIIVFLPDTLGIILFVLLFSAGSIYVTPLIDSLTASIAPKKHLASYMGFVSFGWAIGGALGNALGGIIYNFFIEHQVVYLLWLFFFGIGFLFTLFSRFVMNKIQV